MDRKRRRKVTVPFVVLLTFSTNGTESFQPLMPNPGVLAPPQTRIRPTWVAKIHLGGPTDGSASARKRRDPSRRSRPSQSSELRRQQRDFPKQSTAPLRTNNSKRHRSSRHMLTREHPLLEPFQTAEEIDSWMQSLINNSSFQSIFNDGWNVKSTTEFIRCLGNQGAYQSILLFVLHVVDKPSVIVYTTAISCLAMSRHGDYSKRAALKVLDVMDERQTCPSSYTLVALFQAMSGPEEALALQDRLDDNYPSTEWTIPVYDAALYACSRTTTPNSLSSISIIPPTEPAAWPAASHFIQCMRDQDLRPTARTYLAILQVCTSIKDVPKALIVWEELGQAPIVLTELLWGAVLQTCAVAGDHQTALDLLRALQRSPCNTNVFHCTAYLKALSVARCDRQAIEFLHHMAGNASAHYKLVDLCVPKPDKIAIQTVLNACVATGNYAGARAVLSELRQGRLGEHVQVSTQDYNLVLATCQDPNEAKELLREMRLSRRHRVGATPPDKISYTRAIAVCRKAADTNAARSLLGRSVHDGITPDVYMYSAAIWAAVGAKDVAGAYNLLEEMKANCCSPNAVSYNGIIAVLTQAARVPEAISVLTDMRQRDLRPTLSTFQYLDRAIRLVRDFEDKLLLLEPIFDSFDANDRRVDVSGPIMASLISTYGSLRRFEDARRVFLTIEGPVDAACLRAILFACSTASPPQWNEALVLLHTCDVIGGTRSPTHMDSIAVSNAMLACSKADQWEESLQLLRLYGDNATSPLALNSLIASCGRGGRPDMAIEVLNEMRVYGLQPDTVSYRNAVIACNQAEHEMHRAARNHREVRLAQDEVGFAWWECALSLLRRMQEEGQQPDTQTFSSAISACESAGQWQRALRVLQSTLDDGDDSRLNLYCFNAAIAACEKGGAWVEALEIYERMKAHGGSLRPNFVTIASLVLALDRGGQKELAQEVYREGAQQLRVVQPWRYTQNAQEERVRAMDLHKFSAAMSRAALRSYLERLLAKETVVPADDWIIIVGQGRHSVEEPVLLPTVRRLLQYEYKLPVTTNPVNPGRLVVQSRDLSVLVKTKSWR
jgi:pentatricopeptide repeat domain-containing protein 1